jgi:hypothetical protein
MNILLSAHLAATLAMVGVIWFVQVVHYPLMAEVGPERAVRYARLHQGRTSLVVVPAMLVEAGTGLGLLVLSPGLRGSAPFLASLALLAAIWLSTAFLQVPIHRRLLAGSDPRLLRRLVATNWVRTLGWTARAALLLPLALDPRSGLGLGS